jgi:hypothetical protein
MKPRNTRKSQRIKEMALAAVLGLGSAAGAQAQEQGRPQARQEGIKVHGYWTIDIRNTDGSLASHHEFANALDSFGATGLAEFLARMKSPGVWNIGLWQVGSGLRPPCPSYFNGACVIGEVGSTDPEAQFKTMTVSVPTVGPNAGKLVLSGSATAEADGDIARVYTQLGVCPGTTAPASCGAYREFDFTQRDLSPPLVVLAGQIIQVTVVISFS